MMISFPLREDESRRCSTEVWLKILTLKFWYAKEEEAEAEADAKAEAEAEVEAEVDAKSEAEAEAEAESETAVGCTYSIHDLTPSITVSRSHLTLLVNIVVVVLLLLVLVSSKHR